jgi:hypothetical protein
LKYSKFKNVFEKWATLGKIFATQMAGKWLLPLLYK